MPAHGAGSSCGKNLSTQRTSTIGEQRRTNPSVQPTSEGDFVDLITHGQPAAPSYFSVDAAMNKRVHPLLDQHRKIPHRLRPRSARLSTTAYGWWMPAASTSRPDICGLDQRRRDRRPPGCTWTVPPVRSRALRSSTPPPSTTGTKPRSVRAWGIRSRSANTCRPARIGSARGWPNGPLDPYGAGPCGRLARRAGDRHHIREVQRCTVRAARAGAAGIAARRQPPRIWRSSPRRWRRRRN
jgi:hypothetical protein